MQRFRIEVQRQDPAQSVIITAATAEAATNCALAELDRIMGPAHHVDEVEDKVAREAVGETNLEPIFISAKETARLLGITQWSVYKILDNLEIESRYYGKRRLVVLESVRRFAASLPTTGGYRDW
ncbi:hypothetical protein [Nocardioides sp. AN3]